MDAKIIIICLVIPCVEVLYTENKSKVIKPEFSLKADICKGTGQSLKVNCSIPDKYDRPQKGSFQTSNSHRAFDINRLNILRCTSSDRNSCIPEETTQISEKTLVIYKSHLKESDTGTYFCQYNNISQTEDSFYLVVGDCPVGPRDISCVSMDLKDLQCSWKKSRRDEINPLPVRYKSYFKSSPQFGKIDCRYPKSVSKKSFRDDTSCSISEKFHPSNIYTLAINISNCLGSRTKEHNVSLIKIVKLSPPIILSVEERKTQITLALNYTTNRTLIWIKKILYHVTFTSLYSSHVNNFYSSKGNDIKVILPNLIPYTEYKVTIRIRGSETVGDTYWSRPVTYTYTTKPAAPTAVPDVPPGGFSISSGILNLYLKPISMKDKHAANARYKVAVTSGSSIIRVFNVSWNCTTIANVTTLQQTSDFKIAITTCNAYGETKTATLVTIPGTSMPAPINIIVEKMGNNYRVLWKRENFREQKEEKTFIYWCHGQRSNNICKSDLNWISVSNTHNNVTVSNLTDRLGGEWLFAVSYQYSNGYNTGMVFAECYFSLTNKAPSAVEPFNVVVISPTELQVTPLLYCKYTNRPLKFIVYYKETENNVKTCDKTFQKILVTATIETRKITVKSLKQSMKYAVCMSVITEGGSQISDVQIVQMHDTESNHIYIILGVTAIAVPIIAVVMFLICKFRKNMQKPIVIELPTITPRKYDKVPTKLPEHAKENHNRYSEDSGVSSNTVSASNSSIDDSESKTSIYEQVVNMHSQHECYRANTETTIQKANEYSILNGQVIVQTNSIELENGYKQLPSSFIENKCSNSAYNTSYRKITWSASGEGEFNNYLDEDCTLLNIKGDNPKIVENCKSYKHKVDQNLPNKALSFGKRTSELDSPNSKNIFPLNYISKESNSEIARLLGESTNDQTDKFDKSEGESEEIQCHTINVKNSCIDKLNVVGYVQVGYNGAVI